MFILRFPSYRPFDTDEAAKAAADKKFLEDATARGFIPQEKANTLVAEEKRKLTKQLEDLQANFKGTQKEKEALTQQIEQLKSEYQTSEEKAKDEFSKKTNELLAKLEAESKAATAWKANYAQLLKRNELLRAANQFKAFNPDLIVDLMNPRGDIVERIGDDGTPSGQFEAKFRVSKKGKDGKTVELSVTAEDAVKFMTEQPEVYGSLFQNGKAGGAGGNNNGAGGGAKSVEEMAAAGVSGQQLIDTYRTERKLN